MLPWLILLRRFLLLYLVNKRLCLRDDISDWKLASNPLKLLLIATELTLGSAGLHSQFQQSAMLLAAGKTHLRPLSSGSETLSTVLWPQVRFTMQRNCNRDGCGWIIFRGHLTYLLRRLEHQAAKLLSSLPEFYNPRLEEVSLAPQHAQCGQNLSQENSVTNLCNGSEPPVSSKIFSVVSQHPKLRWDHLLRTVYADYKRKVMIFSFPSFSWNNFCCTYFWSPSKRECSFPTWPNSRSNCTPGTENCHSTSSTEGAPSAAAIQTPEFNHSQTKPSWMPTGCSRYGQKGIANCSYSAS